MGKIKNFSLDDLKGFYLASAKERNGLAFFVLGNSGECKKILLVQRYKSLRQNPYAPVPENIRDIVEALDSIAYNKGYDGITDYSIQVQH